MSPDNGREVGISWLGGPKEHEAAQEIPVTWLGLLAVRVGMTLHAGRARCTGPREALARNLRVSDRP